MDVAPCGSPSGARIERVVQRVVAMLTVLGLALSACADGGTGGARTPSPTRQEPEVTDVSPTSEAAKFKVTSSAFADGERIPAEYSCKGRNVAPPLEWAGVPGGTGSLALVVDDPDAVGGLYVHWVVTDIPPSTGEIAGGRAPGGATVSANSGGKAEYLGPCPPAGTGVHHYRFQLYALPESLGLNAATPHTEATTKIRDTAIGEARVVGTYRG